MRAELLFPGAPGVLAVLFFEDSGTVAFSEDVTLTNPVTQESISILAGEARNVAEINSFALTHNDDSLTFALSSAPGDWAFVNPVYELPQSGMSWSFNPVPDYADWSDKIPEYSSPVTFGWTAGEIGTYSLSLWRKPAGGSYEKISDMMSFDFLGSSIVSAGPDILLTGTVPGMPYTYKYIHNKDDGSITEYESDIQLTSSKLPAAPFSVSDMRYEPSTGDLYIEGDFSTPGTYTVSDPTYSFFILKNYDIPSTETTLVFKVLNLFDLSVPTYEQVESAIFNMTYNSLGELDRNNKTVSFEYSDPVLISYTPVHFAFWDNKHPEFNQTIGFMWVSGRMGEYKVSLWRSPDIDSDETYTKIMDVPLTTIEGLLPNPFYNSLAEVLLKDAGAGVYYYRYILENDDGSQIIYTGFIPLTVTALPASPFTIDNMIYDENSGKLSLHGDFVTEGNYILTDKNGIITATSSYYPLFFDIYLQKDRVNPFDLRLADGSIPTYEQVKNADFEIRYSTLGEIDYTPEGFGIAARMEFSDMPLTGVSLKSIDEIEPINYAIKLADGLTLTFKNAMPNFAYADLSPIGLPFDNYTVYTKSNGTVTFDKDTAIIWVEIPESGEPLAYTMQIKAGMEYDIGVLNSKSYFLTIPEGSGEAQGNVPEITFQDVSNPGEFQTLYVEASFSVLSASAVTPAAGVFERTDLWNKWTVSTPATCENAGERTRTSDMGNSETAEIPALGHEMGEWSVVTPAKCEATGLSKRVCTRVGCEHEETRAIPALGAHKWKVKEVIAPTETEDGYTLYECEYDTAHTKKDNYVKKTFDSSAIEAKITEINNAVAELNLETVYDSYSVNVFKAALDAEIAKLQNATTSAQLSAFDFLAWWNSKWHTVTILDGDSIVGKKQLIKDGSIWRIPTGFTPSLTADMVFKGWSPTPAAVTADLTVNAVYEKLIKEYTVTFTDKDGNVIGNPVTVVHGYAAFAPAPPLADGYKFIGWDSNADDAADTLYKNVTRSMTVKALYEQNEPDKYQVTFFDHNGKQIDIEDVVHGSNAVHTAPPAIPGYKNGTWYPAPVNVTRNMNVYALYVQDTDKWNPVGFTVTKNGNSFGNTANDEYWGFIDGDTLYITEPGVTVKDRQPPTNQKWTDNIVIEAPNVTLEGFAPGQAKKAVISELVGDGDVFIKNHKGELEILGGGRNSVSIVDSEITSISVAKSAESGSQPVSVKMTGTTSVESITISSDALIESDATNIGSVTLSSDKASTVSINAPVTDLNVKSAEATLSISKPIANLTVDAAAENTVVSGSGDGKVENAAVSSNTALAVDVTNVTTNYVISATAGIGGTISPTGNVPVPGGEGKIFTLTADDGYEIDTVTVDGNAVVVTGNSYTFTDVNENHTIDVTFKQTGGGYTPPSNSGSGGGSSGKTEESKEPEESSEPEDNGGENTDTNAPVQPVTFTDVKTDDWYYEAVKIISESGLMKGTGDDEFSPQASMTRAMMITVLARVAGADTDGGETWYTKAVEWAKNEGISDGSDLDGEITREQIVTMLWRYAGMPSADTEITFPDADSISGYASEAVKWAIQTGLVKGYDDGSFKPQNTATRAEIAVILTRWLDK